MCGRRKPRNTERVGEEEGVLLGQFMYVEFSTGLSTLLPSAVWTRDNEFPWLKVAFSMLNEAYSSLKEGFLVFFITFFLG